MTLMLWYCRFTWLPSTTAQQVRERVLQQHDAGILSKAKIKGWYNLPGGGGGFDLVETEDLREVTSVLQPSMDLVGWDVHDVFELPYEQTIESCREPTPGVG